VPSYVAASPVTKWRTRSFRKVSLRILTSDAPADRDVFMAWSRGVARHVLASDWRMRQRARAELSFEDDAAQEICRPIGDPEGDVDARAWLARVVESLDAEGLELLVRRYVLGEAGKKLADELAQSPAALRMRLMRLRSTARIA
jgi:DNA-directed RNA polymerase specialized sigma24 family protein